MFFMHIRMKEVSYFLGPRHLSNINFFFYMFYRVFCFWMQPSKISRVKILQHIYSPVTGVRKLFWMCWSNALFCGQILRIEKRQQSELEAIMAFLLVLVFQVGQLFHLNTSQCVMWWDAATGRGLGCLLPCGLWWWVLPIWFQYSCTWL